MRTHNRRLRIRHNITIKMKMKHNKQLRRRGFSLVELLVVIAIIAGLAAMSYGPIMKQIKASAQTRAINSGKQIHTALFSFAQKNDGIFPNEDTAKSDESGDSAEDNFTQLLNAGVIDDEKTFWNKENSILGVVDGTSPPDGDGALTSGENAWGYVKGLNTSSRTNVPIIFDSSTSAKQFDTAVWEGVAIVGKVDGSVEALKIDFTGAAIDDSGESQTGPILENDKDIFDRVDKISSAEIIVAN